MTKFKRRNQNFEKIKKLGIILLSVILFFSATSVTLSLFNRDKTMPMPVPEAPKPIYVVEFCNLTDFSSYENTNASLMLVEDDTSTNVFTLEYIPDEFFCGQTYFYFDSDEIPESGKKLVMEFDYTMDEGIDFCYAGMVLEDDPYGFRMGGNYLPSGSHSVVIVYDGLDPNLRDDDGIYPEYNFTVYVDNSEVFHFNGSVTGSPMGVHKIQGFGLLDLESVMSVSGGETVFTLHNLTLKVY